MGCFHSILRTRPPPDQSTPTEGEQLPKPSNSDSRSCKSISSPGSSTDLESPLESIAPPAPSEPPDPTEVESTKFEGKGLDLPIKEVKNEITDLITAIKDCQFLSADNRQKIFEDINAILGLISENSLVYTKLEILESQVNTLYRENESHYGEYLYSAIDRIPPLWREFTELGQEQQRQEARMQRASSPIMQFFGHLSRIRSACNAQRDLDRETEGKVGGQFDDVLGGLKDLGSWEAVLKWRVLGMVVGQRRREVEGRLDELLGVRIRVSGLLLEIVDALSEEE